MVINLSKLWEMKYIGTWCAVAQGVAKNLTWLINWQWHRIEGQDVTDQKKLIFTFNFNFDDLGENFVLDIESCGLKNNTECNAQGNEGTLSLTSPLFHYSSLAVILPKRVHPHTRLDVTRLIRKIENLHFHTVSSLWLQYFSGETTALLSSSFTPTQTSQK